MRFAHYSHALRATFNGADAAPSCSCSDLRSGRGVGRAGGWRGHLARERGARKLVVRLGPTGFDMGCETAGAYRGAGYLVKLTCKLIVANEDNYALAA